MLFGWVSGQPSVGSLFLLEPTAMATEKDPNLACPVCLNLDFDRLPKIEPPCALDEYHIAVTFFAVKDSAERGECKPCMIICCGLESMQEQWEEDFLLNLNDTRVLLYVRRGHSLRVTLANVEREMTFEFYTLSDEGILLVLAKIILAESLPR